MKQFYLIGETGLVTQESVSTEEWRRLWAWAVEKGITITQWATTKTGFRCIRAHEGK